MHCFILTNMHFFRERYGGTEPLQSMLVSRLSPCLGSGTLMLISISHVVHPKGNGDIL